MDADVLGDKLPQKPFLDSCCLSLQCQHWESSKVLAGLAFCGMPFTVPTVCFSGVVGGSLGGSAAVCDPNPLCPFAQYRFLVFQEGLGLRSIWFRLKIYIPLHSAEWILFRILRSIFLFLRSTFCLLVFLILCFVLSWFVSFVVLFLYSF